MRCWRSRRSPARRSARLGSQALAVGDRGEVARYAAGQRLAAGEPRRRQVAPDAAAARGRLARPGRAYAVGDEGAMWLWRGETGLWEADPAAPLNFQGNLLGIAFDPANSARGYAVGQSGVLLRYGKSWQQEPLPPKGPARRRRGRARKKRSAARTGRTRTSPRSPSRAPKRWSPTACCFRPPAALSRRAARQLGERLARGPGRRRGARHERALCGRRRLQTAAPPSGDTGALGGAVILERDSAGAGWEPTPTPSPVRRRVRLRRSGKAAISVSSQPEPPRTRARSKPKNRRLRARRRSSCAPIRSKRSGRAGGAAPDPDWLER